MAELNRVSGDDSKCLVQTVSEVMRREPTLEAVKIDRVARSVSVATLGRPDADLERVVTGRIQALQAQAPRCGLLEGDADCASCDISTDPSIQKSLVISSESASTTISRVSCPTAPRFWKWRAFPLPKIVQREVHVEDEATHVQEWRQQIVAALLCGAFTAAAAIVGGTWERPLYIAAYLCGAWFVAQEVWEHLREGKVDVHFLMLTVAAGSASIGAWGEGAV
jgi:Cd2+/Zn2+-exporting ATPase